MCQSTRIHSTCNVQPSTRCSKAGSSVTFLSSHSMLLPPGAVPPESVTYFHGKITREQAEELLFAHGCTEGLFLLRVSVGGNYVISICHSNRVHHYNAERQPNGWYKIQAGRLFPGPVELVQHHAVHLDGFLTLARLPLEREKGAAPMVLQGLRADELELKLRLKAVEMGLTGQSVEEALSGPMCDHIRHLVLKELHKCQRWYHHTTGRREAEQRLLADGNREGAFLVRYRKDDGTYVLSLCSQSEPKHYKIEEHLDRWSIEGGQFFETLMELIDHYHHRQDGLLCKLRYTVAAPTLSKSPLRSKTDRRSTDSPPRAPLVEDIAVQTSLTGSLNEWNASQSLPSLSATPLLSIGESQSSSDAKRTDLISFADSPNGTPFLSSSVITRQPILKAIHYSTAVTAVNNEKHSDSPFSVTLTTPPTPVTDPSANITSVPNAFKRTVSILHNHSVSPDIVHVSRISVKRGETNKPHLVTESVDRSCHRINRPGVHSPSAIAAEKGSSLPPHRTGDSPAYRKSAEVDAANISSLSPSVALGAIANQQIATSTTTFVSLGLSPCRTCVRPASPVARCKPNVTSLEVTTATAIPNIFSSQSLHFSPILDIPWEEPDAGDDVHVPDQGGTVQATGFVPQLAAPERFSNTTDCFSHPFLSDPDSERSTDRPSLTHSPDVTTFCSSACCQNNSKTLMVAARSAWANQFCSENSHLIYDELPPSNFLLDPQNVVLLERLGGGNFGYVVKGVYRTPNGHEIPVAVKTLRGSQLTAAGEREILLEARTMSQLRHRHIVRLIGVCKEEQFMLILELVPLGPINKYLKKRQDVSVHTLTELMYQVAQGMAYLESCKFVHRDLAARNVLLVNRHFAKISDFGMSKALKFGSDYYRAATAGKWPLKWYAPECIYYFRFDSKSDVWSYGITLWEVYSYGERPYRGMKGAQILAMLDQGLRLSKPSRCPDSMYNIMQQCWNFDGVQRPTFADIVVAVSRILDQMVGPPCSTHVSADSTKRTCGASTFGQLWRSDTGTSGSGGSGVNSVSSDRTSF